MPLKIIRTGMSRTGTMSTRTALEALGLRPVSQYYGVVRQSRAGCEMGRGRAPIEWEAVFEGYTAQVDFPGGRVWKQMIHAFPDAKLLHTERPEENWWASFSKAVLKVWASKVDSRLRSILCS